MRARAGKGYNHPVFITASPSSRAEAWAEFDETKLYTDKQHLVQPQKDRLQ